MANACKIKPDKGVELFDKAKKQYDYKTAWNLWALSTIDSFKEGKSFRLDSEGFPLLEDLVKDSEAQKIIGETKLMQGFEKQFEQMPDTRVNYTDLVKQANTYNRNPEHIKYIAIVDSDNGTLKVRISRRDETNEAIASDQYSTIALNEKLSFELSKIGITPDDISEAERMAGRVGVTDFTKAKNLAGDCASVIRIANNHEGAKALGEEFSHLVVGAFYNEPIIQRALDALNDEAVLEELLGDEFDDVYEFQDGNLALVAEEALGKLLRENLFSQVTGSSEKISYLLNRVFNSVRSKFKRLDADRIEEAIIDANSMMGQLAKNILKGQAQLTQRRLALAERMVQFNALSDRVKTNIEILKKARDTEVKRFRISRKSNADEIQAIKAREKTLSEFLKGEKDTRIGIYNYISEAIEDLKNIEESMSSKSLTGAPTAFALRKARSYIQSYAPFVTDILNAITEAKNDEEVPNFLTEIELEDGTVVSMYDAVHKLNEYIKNIAVEYDRYAKQLLQDFLRPFFGEDIAITLGKDRGKKLTLEGIIKEASSDISMMSAFLDTMADSADPLLKLLDVAAKKANDNAMNRTIDTSKFIERMMLESDENGIHDFEWMFEKNSKGKKTGNYISEYNIGLYQEERQKFINGLDAKYGDSSDAATMKKKYQEFKDWHRLYADPEDASMPKQIDRWRNKAYADAMGNSAKKKFYDEFMRLKWQADNQYPDARVSAYKAIQRRKSSSNRLAEAITDPGSILKNTKEHLKETFLESSDDDQLFGEKRLGLTNFDGTEYMTLPVLYTTRLKNAEDLSTDVLSDLLVYTYASNSYNEMDKIIDSLELARNLVNDGVRRVKETRGGNPVTERVTALGNTVTNAVYKGDSNIQRRLNAWMEAVPYQRHMRDAGYIDIPFLGRVNKSKFANWLMGVTSFANLGFNFLANSANVATGAAMLNIEAFSGELFNVSQIRDATGTYSKYLPAYVAELYSRNKTSFLSLFSEFFNIQAEYKKNIKENKKRSVIEKIFGSQFAYFMDRAGNHFLYNVSAIAYCQNIEVLVPKEAKHIKKVAGLKDAEEAVAKILENSEDMELTDDEAFYVNTATGRKYSRVTTVISEDGKEISKNWSVPSTNIGTGIDELVRDFFAGLLVKTNDGKWHHDNKGDKMEIIYPNVKEEDLNAFLEQLITLKEDFDKKGLTIIPNGITARGVLKIKDGSTIRDLNVAGTLDLLAYDKDGNFHIFDMKTHRGKITNGKKYHWSKQLSLYKRFLEEEYGINVKSLNIIPIKVSYPTPLGETSGGEEGTAEYSVIDGTNQLKIGDTEFKGAKPDREQLIPINEVKKIPIEYDNLGYNKQMAPVSDLGNYEKKTLLEALTIQNAFSDREDIKKMVLPEGILDADGIPLDKDKISRAIQDMHIHLFGAYNEEDSNMANMFILGKMLQLHRKWIKPQFNKRFKKAQVNFMTGRFEEGYYRTAAKYAARKFLYRFMNEALRAKVQIPAHWSELNDHEKANIKRAATEILQFFLVCAAVAFIPWPDDKHRPWAMKYAEYMLQREKHELGMLTPSITMAQELQKTVQSPSAVLSTTNKFINLVNSMFTPQDWIDEKQSGPYKGMSTLEANFLRAPLYGITQYRQIDKFANDLDTSIGFYARPSY